MSFWITMHDTSIEACKLYFIKKTSLLSIWFLIWCRKKYQRQTNLCQMNKTEKLCGFDWITESCEVHLMESMLVRCLITLNCTSNIDFQGLLNEISVCIPLIAFLTRVYGQRPLKSSVFRPKTVTPSIFCWFFSKTDLIRSVRKIISLQTVVGI